MAKLYVATKSNWQGDEWKPVDGPHPSRKEAQEKLPKFEQHPISGYSGAVDIKNETHAKVFSHSQLREMGWTDEMITDSLFANLSNL